MRVALGRSIGRIEGAGANGWQSALPFDYATRSEGKDGNAIQIAARGPNQPVFPF